MNLYRFFFFFNDTATTEIYPLPLHDALPISPGGWGNGHGGACRNQTGIQWARSEEHTSELQSQSNLVCRLLLEKKNTTSHLQNHQHPASYQSDCLLTHLMLRQNTDNDHTCDV